MALVVASVPPAAAKKRRPAEELFNPLLGIEYSHWLVGAISKIATEEEIDRYLQLTDDAAAVSFIADFWKVRNEGTDFFQKTPEEIFRQRVEEADHRYREGATPGSRTARGIVYVVYGEPEEIRFESSQKRRGRPVEVWAYPKDAEPGLDGEVPQRSYRFVEADGRTIDYRDRRPTRPRLPVPPP